MKVIEPGFLRTIPDYPPVGVKVVCLKCGATSEVEEKEDAKKDVILTPSGKEVGWWVTCPMCREDMFIKSQKI